ncbi:MAG: AgmX/PglI C-terminal domain-containing protein [Polyangiaceae bacterium]
MATELLRASSVEEGDGMKQSRVVGRGRWIAALCAALLLTALGGCQGRAERLEPSSLTWAELRTVRAGVKVTHPGQSARPPYARERLTDGARIELEPEGVAWLRRDAGATLLVRGPARVTLRARTLRLEQGRVFVDTPVGSLTELETPAGSLSLSGVRASLEVRADGQVKAYVLSGELRAGQSRATAGEEISLVAGRPAQLRAVKGFQDWTGGLATTDRGAAPTPFGVGSVGARAPSEQGAPRFPLAIQRMDVRVRFDGDFAVTEVDQVFFNPSSQVVEGIYSFRTPPRAVLERFGVDRKGELVWGQVKEKAAAAAQYQANVYQGSREDPALLEWDAPGSYRARLYPIGPGASRRVVVKYAEWLDRSGAHGERRLYVYPMAAEGSEESLPHVEELKVTFELGHAGAREVRVGMAGERRADQLLVRAHDFVPRADLALELFDDGVSKQRAFTAPSSNGEAPFVLVPVRPGEAKLPEGGLDLVVLVDASAATDSATLSVARAATTALLAQLGERDRALVLAGDAGLRPVVPELSKLTKMDAASRDKIRDGLSGVLRGGATDLGAMLAEAAEQIDPARRAALVYVGDAAPTVGELSLKSLRQRLGQLPRPVRVFGLGVGDSARLELLAGLARGAFAERVGDASQAAQAALRVLAEAERPAWLGTKIDLGPQVERVFPREASALVDGETLWVIGRYASGKEPDRLRIQGPLGAREAPLALSRIDDSGDLGRRWAEARLAQMLEDGEGRASLVDLGMKSGIITPVTSLYVPTEREASTDEQAKADQRRDALVAKVKKRAHTESLEGGTGTRAKGEESKAAPALEPVTAAAAAPAAPAPARPEPDPMAQRQAALREASEFGMIGAAKKDSAAQDAPEEAAPPPAASAPSVPASSLSIQELSARGNMWGDEIGDAFGSGGLGLAGIGAGGGGVGQGFGAGHGRLGGSHATAAPKVSMGRSSVTGNLPSEVVQRIVRQNFGRFRLCYEAGLGRNPALSGRVPVRFVIDRSGSVSNVANGGSELPDSSVVSCVLASFYGLSFPQPEGGIATVTLPISFAPASGGGAPGRVKGVAVHVFVGDLPRSWLACSAAASVPLESRVPLWRERLAKVANDADGVAEVYRGALRDCEAPTFRERSRLLALMLDVMPGVARKVALYQVMLGDLGAADVLYRALLARVRTPAEMRELHGALGLTSFDALLLEKLIQSTPDARQRAARLNALILEFPDDFALALALLDALEDAGELGSLRDAARRLRERRDADANVRTAVGELYFRLAAREQATSDKEFWLAEARRALGEIVEFAPDDPVARHRLGDLLLSHGFFADAKRQYETLAELVPDDSKVLALLAAAAQGRGQLEEALKWLDRGAAAETPEASAGLSVRALSATYLAWARADARQQSHAEELSALIARSARVLGKAEAGKPPSVRASLTWSHPELHPTLWSNALGTLMPATDGDVTLGIAQVNLPERDASVIEVRLEPRDLAHVARLGAQATLTVVFDELADSEKVVREVIRFERGGPPTQRFRLSGKEVRRD